MIQCNNLCKCYQEFEALHEINLEIGSGQIVGLLGANGSGKTTLIKLICGLLKPTSGEILINGLKPGVESKKLISYLPENNFLDLGMRVRDTVKYFESFYDDFDADKALRLINEMEISEQSKLRNLSKGMKEKVSLSLVISRNAQYYILDEPIGGVDPSARDRILDTILSNFNEGATVIISTHLISDVEKILDEVIFLRNGKIMMQENADDLRTSRGKSIDAVFREEYR